MLDDWCRCPSAKACRIAPWIQCRLVRFGQHESIVYSVGTELVTVKQREAKVLTRQRRSRAMEIQVLRYVVFTRTRCQLEDKTGLTDFRSMSCSPLFNCEQFGTDGQVFTE
jgi:hypothetical protein